MKVLITGGAGFIGSHLVERLLQDGHEATLLDDFNDYYAPALKRKNIEDALKQKSARLFEGDICAADFVAGAFEKFRPEIVVHLAARAGVRASLKNPLLYTQVNVSGTLNLLECARKFGVQKFIFGSSSSVYGANATLPFCESEANLHPISPYGVSKLCAEAYGKVYSHLHQIPVVVLRFFTVYGPRQRPDMAIHKFARRIESGQEIEVYGDGKTERDYTFVSDIVEGIIAAVKRPAPSRFEIYNLGDSRRIELAHLLQLLEQNLGKKARVRRLPEQPGDVPRTWADISKAKKDLGYKPLVPIEEGIKKFVAWFKNLS